MTLHNQPAIVLDNVRVRYDVQKSLVLNIERLSIRQGERVALTGPSGAGKTTLLRLLNGYVQPEAGRIQAFGAAVDSKSVRRREIRRRIGFVFQEFNLVDRATVFENVLWGRLGRVNPILSLFGYFPKADKEIAMQAIAEVDLVAQANQRADTLSGGQKQRVAIARVLAQGARLILADEPVSNLDPALADEVLGLLADVSRRHNVTLLMSVHQPELARRFAERIIGMRAGGVVFDEAPEAFDAAAMRSIYGRSAQVDAAMPVIANSSGGVS
jgi:phosphonate transport system ATP-binding protein